MAATDPADLIPRYPAALRTGSRLFVTAPSSGVQPPLHRRLDLGLQWDAGRGGRLVQHLD